MRYTNEEINLLEHGGYDINTLPERLHSKLETVICERCQLPFVWVSNKKYCKECLRYRQIHWRERSKSYKAKGRVFKSFNFVDLNNTVIFCKKQSDLKKYLEDTIPDFKFNPIRRETGRPFMHQKTGWVVPLSYPDPIAAIGEELIKRSTRTYTKEPKRLNKKLTEEQILSISKDTRIRRVIAEEYGVSKSLVNKIHIGEIYSHITGIEYRKTYKTSRNWSVDRAIGQKYRERANPSPLQRKREKEIKTITMYSSYEINEDGILVYKGIGSSVKGIINEYEVYAIGLYGLIHGSMLAEELGFVYIQILKAGKSTYKAFQKN